MNLGVMTKRPDDVLDYDIDLAARWLPEADRITGAVAHVEGGTAVIDETTVSDGVVRVWVSGGIEGETNTISLDVTSAHGRTKEFCFHLRITRC